MSEPTSMNADCIDVVALACRLVYLGSWSGWRAATEGEYGRLLQQQQVLECVGTPAGPRSDLDLLVWYDDWRFVNAFNFLEFGRQYLLWWNIYLWGGGGTNIESFWYTKYYLLRGHIITVCPKACLLICLNFREGMWDFMKPDMHNTLPLYRYEIK